MKNRELWSSCWSQYPRKLYIIFPNKELTISCIQDEWHEACGEMGSRARINRGHWAEDTCWHRSPGYTIRPTEENVMESCEPWLSATRSSSSSFINALNIWQQIPLWKVCLHSFFRITNSAQFFSSFLARNWCNTSTHIFCPQNILNILEFSSECEYIW